MRSSANMARAGLSAASAVARVVMACSGALLLAACQTFSPDGGIAPVAAVTQRELGQEVTVIRSAADAAVASGAVRRLLRRPLTVDAAVQIALLNNRALQAAYNELGVAEAMMVGASLPPNPAVSLSRISGTGELEIERRIIADILALATLPVRAELASDRFRQAQLRAIAETLRAAIDARRAYYRAVAAQELVGFLAQAQGAADTAAQLARRLGETGALNKLDQAREQVFYADITTQVASARLRAEGERERLVRALGLWGGELDFRLANALAADATAAEGAGGRRDRRGAPPRRSADGADRGRGAGEVVWADAGHALHQPAGGGRRVARRHARRSRRRCASAASRSSSRFRCSTSAKCACAMPSRATSKPSTG